MAGQRSKSAELIIPVLLIIILSSCKTQVEEVHTHTPVNETFIRLSDAQIQLANIKVTDVREGLTGQRLALTGVLKDNEQTAYSITTRLNGRIEKLYFKNTGETVNKGDKLYEFYSDDLAAAQREYINIQSNNWNFTGKYEPSLILKDELLVMGLVEQQIEQLKKDGKILFRVTIYSPAKGKIRAINVTEGEYVTEGQSLFELVNDDDLWIEAQIYPDEAHYFESDMQAIAIIPAAGEVPVLCNIIFINPLFETGRNVILVRAVIKNPDKRLHPGMLAVLYVRTNIRHGIIIPSTAVITTSEGDRVWVQEENGDFSGRLVTTGMQAQDSTLVLSGLKKTDKIVYSGAYLLNSEFILRYGKIPSGGEKTTDLVIGQVTDKSLIH
jgi:Cu(I)/Ag(I) efflux system membrane fusion protein